jgi:hypothetical protein
MSKIRVVVQGTNISKQRQNQACMLLMNSKQLLINWKRLRQGLCSGFYKREWGHSNGVKRGTHLVALVSMGPPYTCTAISLSNRFSGGIV